MALSMAERGGCLDLIVAYESGKVAVFRHLESLLQGDNVWLDENIGWRLLCESHQHKEPSRFSAYILAQIALLNYASLHSHGLMH